MIATKLFKGPEQFQNWDRSIKGLLQKIAAEQFEHQEIIRTIRQFKMLSNNVRRRRNSKDFDSITFEVLLAFYEPKLRKTFALIAQRILNPPKTQIPLFEANITQEHTFQKSQIVYLLCLMAMCLVFPQDYSQRDRYSWVLDFSYVFSQEELKTKTVMEYFIQVLPKPVSAERMTVRRESVSCTLSELLSAKGKLWMSNLQLEDDTQDIENCFGSLKIDFANKFIGGGALLSGCVQEELMFANRPQMFATQLLCQVMGPNQALYFHGFRKHFRNTGYGFSAEFAGRDETPYIFEGGRANDFIVAIDAINFRGGLFSDQIHSAQINRQIFKAYCGFKISENKNIATGNWGCGAFRGDVKVKLLIQWIAASLAEKQLRYCPFGSRVKVFDETIFVALQQRTVNEVIKLLHAACQSFLRNPIPSKSIYEALKPLL